jgi:hypothetical protein
MMRRLLGAAAVSFLLVPAGAQADWVRWSCVDEESEASPCSALTTNPDGGAYLAITYFSKDPGPPLQRIMLGSADWSAPDGRGATVRFTAQPSGVEYALQMNALMHGLYAMYDGVPGVGMSPRTVEKVIALFESDAESVILDFANGGRWEVPLDGAASAVKRARGE